MRIIILAGSEGWHVGDLRRAAQTLGLEVVTADFCGLSARLGGAALGEGDLPGATTGLSPGDRLLVRSMPGGSLEQVVFRMDVLQRLEASGVRVVNRSRALEAAIDKYLSLARLEAAGLPVPETFVSEQTAGALEAFERLGGDVVMKPIFGSEGRGLERLTSPALASERCAALEAAGSVIYLQRFVRHPGHDYRILVLGGEVLCGMRRAATASWITNVARGATPLPLDVTPELASLAVRAAAALGAEVAGVDILPDADGRLWVLEVNGVPGWRALAQVTGIDVAARILEQVAA